MGPPPTRRRRQHRCCTGTVTAAGQHVCEGTARCGCARKCPWKLQFRRLTDRSDLPQTIVLLVLFDEVKIINNFEVAAKREKPVSGEDVGNGRHPCAPCPKETHLWVAKTI
ncbi:hypothetical protein MRX96_039302 [Rhipicephalus microplus]